MHVEDYSWMFTEFIGEQKSTHKAKNTSPNSCKGTSVRLVCLNNLRSRGTRSYLFLWRLARERFAPLTKSPQSQLYLTVDDNQTPKEKWGSERVLPNIISWGGESIVCRRSAAWYVKVPSYYITAVQIDQNHNSELLSLTQRLLNLCKSQVQSLVKKAKMLTGKNT